MNIQELKIKNEKIYQKALKTKLLLEQEDLSKIKNPEDINNPILFFTIIATLTAQSKAPLSEKFIGRKLNMKKIAASLDRGDFTTFDGEYLELKTSFTNAEQCLNLRQIRLWQNVDYYLCIYIDEEDLSNSLVFYLTKEQMKEEISLIGGFTHGTKEANLLNENNEYSITIKTSNNNDNLIRWKNKYFNNQIYDLLFQN